MKAEAKKEDDLTVYHIDELNLIGMLIQYSWEGYLTAVIEQVQTEKNGVFAPDPDMPHGHEGKEHDVVHHKFIEHIMDKLNKAPRSAEGLLLYWDPE